MGPAFVGAGFSSGEIIIKTMEGQYPGVPRLMVGLVDVREVAEAHLQAILKPEAANKRFILVNTCVWL